MRCYASDIFTRARAAEDAGRKDLGRPLTPKIDGAAVSLRRAICQQPALVAQRFR